MLAHGSISHSVTGDTFLVKVSEGRRSRLIWLRVGGRRIRERIKELCRRGRTVRIPSLAFPPLSETDTQDPVACSQQYIRCLASGLTVCKQAKEADERLTLPRTAA